VGWENWHTEDRKDGDTYFCQLGITLECGGTTTKTGAAGATDVEGEKGGASDAFKRAAVLFGVGRYLYYLDSPWIAIEPAGKSYRIVKSEYAKLKACLPKHNWHKDGCDQYFEQVKDKIINVDSLDKLKKIWLEYDKTGSGKVTESQHQDLLEIATETKANLG